MTEIKRPKRRLRKSIRYSLYGLVGALMVSLGFFIGEAVVTAYQKAQRIDAYHINVDGELRYTIHDLQEFHRRIQAYKERYMFNVDENANVVRIDLLQSMEIVPVKVHEETLSSFELIQADLDRIDQEAWVYTIQPGDTLWDLQSTLKVSLSDMMRFNPDADYDKIFPGDELLLRPEDPYYDVEIQIYNTVREAEPYLTEYIRDATLLATQRVVVKAGVEGEKDVTYDIRLKNGYEDRIDVAKEVMLKEPTTAVVRVGTKRTLSRISSTNFGVTTGRFTSGFGTRTHPITGRRTTHNGIDIANAVGTPIYAYAEGRVIIAGWDGALGYAVAIDHGGGLVTKYGHLSKVSVSVGQRVSVGARIGSMGSTGFSTGSHLHFEVILNGRFRNPLDYI